MSKYKEWGITLLMGLQMLFIVGSVITNEYKLSNAKLIVVKLNPLDPRSLIQGDYVILGYAFDQEVREALKDREIKAFKVVLMPYKSRYVFSRVCTLEESCELIQEEVFLRGERLNRWGRITYGIETYFIEEGTGVYTEENASYAKIKVTSSGEGFVVDLLDSQMASIINVP